MELRGEPKFALQNCEVGGSVFVDKMHTPETKKYHFSKKFACGGRLICDFMHKMFTSGMGGPNFI